MISFSNTSIYLFSASAAHSRTTIIFILHLRKNQK